MLAVLWIVEIFLLLLTFLADFWIPIMPIFILYFILMVATLNRVDRVRYVGYIVCASLLVMSWVIIAVFGVF